MDERERQVWLKRAENGRKYKIAKEIFSKFLEDQRNQFIDKFENSENPQELLSISIALRVIKDFKHLMEYEINMGELAEKELSENGE